MEFSKDMFQPADKSKLSAETIARPSTTYWQDAWRRLKMNKMAMAGLVMIILMIIMAIVGPMLTPYSYSDQSLLEANQWPNAQHWFGTDDLGRDIFTRIWYGARISLFIGIATAILVFFIGVLYGGISGYMGGKVDEIMMRIVEILWAIPYLLYVIMLMVVLGPGLKTIFIALGAVYWLSMARIVRGQILQLKEQEYVLAAKTLGADWKRILFRHLIPNAMGPIIIAMTLTVPEAIFTEAWLSFLGLGVSAPVASWGTLANEGLQGLRSYPYQLFFPALFITITILAFNFLGDGLRDALDPKMRK